MDKLYIKNLTLKTTIGCHDWEKQLLQTIIVDIEMGIDCKQIAQTDALNATIDYVQMVDKLTAFAASAKFDLIETLIEKIAQFLHQHYSVIKQLKISLDKPGAMAQAKTVGVMIERIYE
jgi:7,8-dihydroneopterin aldolase/epimerase/oxygenase